MRNIWQKLAEHRVLETERLRLRPVTLADAEDMFAYASDPDNVRWTFMPNQSLEETQNIIAAIYLASPLGRWGIELKETGQLIGTIDMHNLAEAVGRAEFGYTLNKTFWNKGYMTEAAQVFVKLFFETLEMSCLVAKHDQDNPASGRVMEKIGMTFSHDEPYAKRDKKDLSRILTLRHYLLTKETYFSNLDTAVNHL